MMTSTSSSSSVSTSSPSLRLIQVIQSNQPIHAFKKLVDNIKDGSKSNNDNNDNNNVEDKTKNDSVVDDNNDSYHDESLSSPSLKRRRILMNTTSTDIISEEATTGASSPMFSTTTSHTATNHCHQDYYNSNHKQPLASQLKKSMEVKSKSSILDNRDGYSRDYGSGRDSDGLSPLDHLLVLIYNKSTIDYYNEYDTADSAYHSSCHPYMHSESTCPSCFSETEGEASKPLLSCQELLEAIQYLVSACPRTVQDANNEVPCCSSTDCSSPTPLLRLLSMRPPQAISEMDNHDQDAESTLVISTFYNPLRSAVRILINANPSLLTTPSVCGYSPLHWALLNHRHDTEMIQCLLETSTKHGLVEALLSVRSNRCNSGSSNINKVGDVSVSSNVDMPLHTAIAARNSLPTIQLLLKFTVAYTTCYQSMDQLVQCRDENNLTPFHLAWIARVDPVFGMFQTRRRLRGAGALYGNMLDDAVKDLEETVVSNSRNIAVEAVFGSFWTNVCQLLFSSFSETKEIQLQQPKHEVLQVQPQKYPCQISRNSKMSTVDCTKNALPSSPLYNMSITNFPILHAIASLPKCPLAILRAAIILHPEQTRMRDFDNKERRRLPLHVACANIGESRFVPWWLSLSSNGSSNAGGNNIIQPQQQEQPQQPNTTTAVEILLKSYPRAASIVDANYRLPLHIALESLFQEQQVPITTFSTTALLSQRPTNPRPTWQCIQQYRQHKQRTRIYKAVVAAYPASLERRDRKNGLYPFMSVAAAATSQIVAVPTTVQEQGSKQPNDASSIEPNGSLRKSQGLLQPELNAIYDLFRESPGILMQLAHT
mmetsp:Transcript_50298/g.58702  ORF Transcript_50298/g.58702 Transcript_50298/m.58702 type:complete len:825 (-) Transcript_50298:316-2790(-)